MTFRESDPNLILATDSDFGGAGFEATVWRTADAGATWTKTFEGTQDFYDVMDVEIVQDGTNQTALASYRAVDGSQLGGSLRSTDAGGSQGTLCLGGSVGRYSQQAQQSGSAGAFSLPIDLTAIPQPMGAVSVLAGQTWSFQCWHRDANLGITSHLSNGLPIQFM